MQHEARVDRVSSATSVQIAEEQKVLDLTLTVQQLCLSFPELPAILADLGFTEIVKPLMLATVGKVMTIPRGAALRALDLEEIKAQLIAQGYSIKGDTE